MEHRALGASGIHVSVLSLGSWQTYEHIPREQGVSVMRAAREAGVTFLDDARYDDRTGRAPIPTGYSEVVFGELFRAAGWRRDEVVVANKLWWEFWPEQSAEKELDASLGRMGLDDVDLIYSERPPEGLAVREIVDQVAGLLRSGKARAWGVLNWHAELVACAAQVASDAGIAAPCAAQLVYSLASHEVVESDAMGSALDRAGTSVVASSVLAGGALSGKYARGQRGRLSGRLEAPRRRRAVQMGQRLGEAAGELQATPAQLALVFALSGPRIASVLFGATSPEQVRENVAALELLGRLTDAELSELRALADGDA